MVSPYKTFLKCTIGLAGTLMLGCVALIYILDPFQIYHTSYFYPDKYIGNQDRFQTAGLINRLWDERDCCDSILLGTSHSQNFDGDEMGTILGTKPVLNLSMSGAKPYEQDIILSHVLSVHRPQTVFWEIDEPFSVAQMTSAQCTEIQSGRYMPAELYNHSFYDDGLYLFSLDSITYAMRGFWIAEPLNIYKAWYYQNLESFGKGDAILRRNLPLYQNNPAFLQSLDTHFLALDEVVFKAVAENPDIQFHIFLPPYSHLYYASLNQDEYTRLMQMRRHIAMRSDKFPNARFYAFDLLDKIPTADLNRYKDKGHYHPDVNRQMVMYIKDGKGQLTPANIDRHIRTLHSRIQDYGRKMQGKSPFHENGS